MTYTITSLIKRKEGLSPAEFRWHYDNVHIPLVRALVGPTFPLSHTRIYVTRNRKTVVTTEDGKSSQYFSPVIHLGDPSADIDYDSVTMMVWENKMAFDRFNDALADPENMAQLLADTGKFADASKLIIYAVEEPVVACREE